MTIEEAKRQLDEVKCQREVLVVAMREMFRRVTCDFYATQEWLEDMHPEAYKLLSTPQSTSR